MDNTWITRKIKKQVKANSMTAEQGLSYVLKFGLLGEITKEQETELVSWLESQMPQEKSGEED